MVAMQLLLNRAAGAAAACLITAGLAGVPMPSLGQSAPSIGPSRAAETEAFVGRLHAQIARMLSIPSDQAIDAELRSAATAMVAKELPRMKQVLTAWAAEHQGKRTIDETFLALQSRAFNEMGLWLLDREGPAHDRLLQQAYAKPRSCDFVRPRGSLFGMVVQAWQQVPAPQRALLLAGEARLLGRWGTQRPLAPARPVEAVSDAAMAAIHRHVAQGTPLPRALPPIMAWRLFAQDGGDAKDRRPDAQRRCLARHWALQVALARGDGTLRDDEWTAYLYDRVPDARDLFVVDPNRESDPHAHPEPASMLRVEGQIAVELEVDDQGKVVDARVTRRQVTAFGIEGQRPVIFETLLDEASLQRARARTFDAAGTASAPNERRRFRLPFNYILEE